MYKLNIGKTYATVTKAYTSGNVYSAEELGAVLNDTNDRGERYFVKIEDSVAPVETPVEPPSSTEGTLGETDTAEANKKANDLTSDDLKAGETSPTSPPTKKMVLGKKAAAAAAAASPDADGTVVI